MISSTMGLLSLLFLQDSPTLKPHRGGTFFKQFASVINFKSFFERKELVLVSATATLFFIPFNTYFVHMGNWMIYHMGFNAESMGIIQGVGLILAMLLSIPGIRFINSSKTPYVAAAAIVINMIGLWILYLFVKPGTVNTVNIFYPQNLLMLVAIFLAGGGYVMIVQSLTMWMKQLYPAENRAGTVVLPGGEKIEISDFTAFCEHAVNRW